MDIQEVKLHQMTNQHLILKTDKITAIRDLCGYQAQFYGNALHGARIRTNGSLDNETWSTDLVKTWGHRGTMHIFSRRDMPLFVRECKTANKVCESGWYSFLVEQGIYISPERNRYFANLIVEAIAKGNGTRDELKKICFKNGLTSSETEHVFNKWGGTIAELAGIGVLVFKVQEKKEYELCEPFTPMPEKDAFVEIVRRYFTHFGPATLRDAAYFMKKTQSEIKNILVQLPAQTFVCEKKTYYYIENNRNYNLNMPRCLFLAGFDQLILGYEKKDSIYLNEQHLRNIFNLNGIVFPSLMVDGEVVGRWKEIKKKIVITPFRILNTTEKKIIADETEKLWLNNLIEYM